MDSSENVDSSQSRIPRVRLGRTGIETSALALGAWGFGSASAPSAQVGDDERLAALLQEAFALGVRLLDSADSYDNEDRIGRILDEVGRPSDLTVISKFGHGKGFHADQFRASAERTLGDLGIDRIDLMMVHDPRDAEDMATVMGPRGALEGMRTLQDEGLVGHIGVATGTLPPLQQAVDSGEFDCIEFPRLYTLLNPAARTSGLLEAAKERNMGTLAAAPFAGNILATGSRVEPPLYCYRPALPEVVQAVRKMEQACERLGVALPAAALAFCLTDPMVDSVVVGVSGTQELLWDIEAFDIGIDRDALEAIAAAGAVDPHLLGGPDFLKPFPTDRMPPGPLR
jgi:D-threo-aldose 1-dehydrogenase